MDARPQATARSSLDDGFTLGAFHVDPRAGRVTGPGGTQQLDPKVMGVLVVLAERAGHVVPREDLMARLWPNAVVTDDALTRCLYELRRQLALAGGGDGHRALVETLPKRGYLLNGSIAPLSGIATPAPVGRTRRTVAWVGGAVAALALALVAVLVLKPFAPRPAPSPGHAIAVLPFADLTEGGDQQYFSDGISEEILHRLTQLTDLRVIARTSSFQFREPPLDVAEIASRLNVTHVLEGSVRRSGNRVRVTAQLIDAEGSHVWSDVYERELGDVFAIQDEVAADVAARLQATLVGDRPAEPRPASFAAFDRVLQGEYLYYRRAPGDIERSIELFEEATRIDPGYARAWADLAGAYSLYAWTSDPPSATLIARQGEAALRAVELDPSLARAHARLAQYYFEKGDQTNQAKHLRIAYELDANDPLVLGFMASDLLDAGELGQAIELQQRALRRDPMSALVRQNLTVTLIADGRLDEALANQRTLLEQAPDTIPDREIEVARILTLQGRHDEAAASALELPEGRFRDHALALLYTAPRHRSTAEAALARLTAAGPAPSSENVPERIVDAVRLAEAYTVRRQPDAAFAVLEAQRKALAERPQGQAYVRYLRREARLSPFLRTLHADPGWTAFLADEP